MKYTSLFLIGFLVLHLETKAQTYQPILSEPNSWNVFWGACDASQVDSIFSVQDSIVDHTIYASLYSGQLANKIGNLEEDTLYGNLIFRDNSEKVFPVYIDSLIPGDTITYVNSFENEIELIVTDTSTRDGLKHIELNQSINLCSFSAALTMIESVGPNIGIQNMAELTPGNLMNYMLCNYKSDKYYFGNELFDNACYLNWTAIELASLEKTIDVHVQQERIVIHNQTERGTVSIYTLQGVKVHEQKLLSGTTTIDLSSTSTGVYIYRVQIGELVISEKFVR